MTMKWSISKPQCLFILLVNTSEWKPHYPFCFNVCVINRSTVGFCDITHTFTAVFKCKITNNATYTDHLKDCFSLSRENKI